MAPEKKFQYRCSQCGQRYTITPEMMLCPACSSRQGGDEPLRGILEVALPPLDVRPAAPLNMGEWLPVDSSFFPPVPVGGTPLWRPQRLRRELAFPGLLLKDDAANPTGSLKDRASYLVSAFARSHGINHIVLASTGNAGSSMAGIGAAAGQRVTLFLPAGAPAAKLVQSRLYGAEVISVPGSYDQACREAARFAAENPQAMSRSTAYNPMTLEGKKTAALEIYQQMGNRAPRYIFVPVGDGCIIGGIIKGFQDLLAQGLVEAMPRIIGVQSRGSRAITRAWRKAGVFEAPRTAQTLADSISVDVPAAGYYVVEKLKEHQGEMILVSDEEILQAQSLLASRSGLFAEPAAAAAFAGFIKKKESLPPEDKTVVLITGTGLKDIEGAQKAYKEGVKHG